MVLATVLRARMPARCNGLMLWCRMELFWQAIMSASCALAEQATRLPSRLKEAVMSISSGMRRTDLAMSEQHLLETLERGHCGRLATVSADGYPYCVPLLYVWADGQVFLHTARARGHLHANLEHEPRVCFEVDEPGKVFPYGRFECDTTLAYRSVVLFGRIGLLDDVAIKRWFFTRLMTKYAAPAPTRPQGFLPRIDQIDLYAIAPERMTGKEIPLPAMAQRWPALDRTKTPHAQPDAAGDP
jgi:nitroimidazol reductase NimA-like FMN-containing flavoprotein (pyridoxamine 5'-phosphate oxidase superfamily)